MYNKQHTVSYYLEIACLTKINLHPFFTPCFYVWFSPLSFSHHPHFSPCVCFSSLHQCIRPMTVPGLPKWMTSLFLEPEKEGKQEVSLGERGREGGGGGTWGDDKSAVYCCLWSIILCWWTLTTWTMPYLGLNVMAFICERDGFTHSKFHSE